MSYLHLVFGRHDYMIVSAISSEMPFSLYNFLTQHMLSQGKGPSLFCVAKRKKGDKDKKERVSKQKLLKGCHQGQNIIVLATLERLEFENFSCRPTMVANNTFQCSMAPSPL